MANKQIFYVSHFFIQSYVRSSLQDLMESIKSKVGDNITDSSESH
jgi:hypothetical protein